MVKKCNAIGHLAKGSAHNADLLALTDDLPAELEDLFEKKGGCPGPSNLTTAQLRMQTMLCSFNAVNRQQLLKTFNLCILLKFRCSRTVCTNI